MAMTSGGFQPFHQPLIRMVALARRDRASRLFRGLLEIVAAGGVQLIGAREPRRKTTAKVVTGTPQSAGSSDSR